MLFRSTVMNGALMRNFANADRPFASALIGDRSTYVSEVDESDGSTVLYRPDVAVVTNIRLDHKSLDELHALFGDFAAKARLPVINADDPELAPLPAGAQLNSFGFANPEVVRSSNFAPITDGCLF